jgi:hypothetical protein
MAHLPGGLLGFGPIATLPIGDDILQLSAAAAAAAATVRWTISAAQESRSLSVTADDTSLEAKETNA